MPDQPPCLNPVGAVLLGGAGQIEDVGVTAGECGEVCVEQFVYFGRRALAGSRGKYSSTIASSAGAMELRRSVTAGDAFCRLVTDSARASMLMGAIVPCGLVTGRRAGVS